MQGKNDTAMGVNTKLYTLLSFPCVAKMMGPWVCIQNYVFCTFPIQVKMTEPWVCFLSTVKKGDKEK